MSILTIQKTGEKRETSTCEEGASEVVCEGLQDVCETFVSTGNAFSNDLGESEVDAKTYYKKCGRSDESDDGITYSCMTRKSEMGNLIGNRVQNEDFNCERKVCQTDLCNSEAGEEEEGGEEEGGDGGEKGKDGNEYDPYVASGKKMTGSLLLIFTAFTVFCSVN